MSQASYFTAKTVPYSGHKDGTGSRVQGYEDVIGDWLFEAAGATSTRVEKAVWGEITVFAAGASGRNTSRNSVGFRGILCSEQTSVLL